jgi:hypothetical protein
MRTEQLIGITLASFAFVLLLLAHFLPAHTYSGNGVEYETTIWGMDGETSMSLPGMSFEESFSAEWADSDFDGDEGISELRAAGPLMIVATVMAFAAITASLLTVGQRSNLLPFALMATSSLFVILSLVLYESGINAYNSQMSYTYGFAIIVAAIATAALATVMLIVPNTSNGSATAE